jgi:TolA-binding protein
MGIEQIQKIHEFGEINVIISLLLCAMLVIALKAGWEKLLDVLGLETKASLQKKALEKKLSDMEQKIADFEQSQHNYHDQSINIRDDLEDNQKVLQDGINELKTLLINKEIDDIRTTILDFSNAVMNGRDYNKEQYEHIIDLYDKYEKILEQNGMTNGRVTASMEFVLKNYQDLMDNGFKK